MLLSLLQSIVLGAVLRVQSDGTCPSPEAVAASVQSIVELSEASEHEIYATVQRDGAWLDLRLLQANGTALGERRVEASDDCQAQARTAAVVIAAWLSNEHPEFLVALPSDAPAPTPPPAASPRPPSTPPVTPPVTSTPRAVEPAAPKRPSSKRRRRFRLAAAIGGSATSNAFAPAAWLGAAYGPGGSGWGARLSLAWIGSRTEPLEAHEVSWSRWPVMLGPYWSLARGSMRFDLEAGPALGWLRLEGRNFSQNFAHSDATWGAYGSLRFVPKLSRIAAFVAITPLFWIGKSTASVTSPDTGATTEKDLPRFELLVTGGMQLPL